MQHRDAFEEVGVAQQRGGFAVEGDGVRQALQAAGLGVVLSAPVGGW
ncbi:hypothetical protein ACFCYI_00465 [Streptomyces sp. NPDC056257]